MALILKVNAVDRTDQVDWQSFRKLEVVSKEPNILDFRVKNYGTKTFRPALNDAVEVTLDSLKIFAGTVVETEEVIEGQLKFFSVVCKDPTHELDRVLVPKRYEIANFPTVKDIVDDIISTFTTGFTTTNVVAPINIQDINYNYFYVSDALQKLADQVGYDWYVDYDSDIHFFEREVRLAPFNLFEPTVIQQQAGQDGNFVWGSFRVNENIHQLRNHIFVRGGTFLGNLRTKPFIGDGSQDQFHIGDRHVEIEVKVATVLQTLGTEGIDDDDVSIATLYNADSGYIRFKTPPPDGDAITIESRASLAINKEFKDAPSIATFGTFQFVIVDKQILSSKAALIRAQEEIRKWGDEIRDATFVTYKDGLQIGEKITVTLPTRSISRTFRINRILTTSRGPEGDMQYEVSLLASEKTTMIDVLADLLINRPNTEIDILEDEVIDLVSGYFESIVCADSYVITIHGVDTPDWTETITITGDVDRVNPFNPPTWVAGHYFPLNDSDPKRHPRADTQAQAS